MVDETRIPKAVQVSAAHRGVVHAHELLSHRSYMAGTGQAGELMEKELWMEIGLKWPKPTAVGDS